MRNIANSIQKIILSSITLLYTLAYMSTLAERIRWVMQKFNLTQQQLADIAGVKQPSVNRWVNGGAHTIKSDPALRICKRLPILMDWLVNGRGEPIVSGGGIVVQFDGEQPEDGYVEIKAVRIRCAAGNGIEPTYEEANDLSTKSYRQSWLQKHRLNPDRLIVMEVDGDSMEPFLWDGDSITVNTADRHILNGKVYAFTYRGEFRVKRLRKLLNGGLEVLSDNPTWRPETIPPDEMEWVYIVGRVVDRSGTGGL